MNRGEVWTVSGQGYAGKPRPSVIIQSDRFAANDSISICSFTTDPTEAPLFRIPVDPDEDNGLEAVSRLMVDKITTVPRNRLGEKIGYLDDADMRKLDQAIMNFLGLGR